MDLNPVGNKLYFQTEAQEDAGQGQGTEIVYLPVDAGVDTGVMSGVVSPFINLLTTHIQSAGAHWVHSTLVILSTCNWVSLS